MANLAVFLRNRFDCSFQPPLLFRIIDIASRLQDSVCFNFQLQRSFTVSISALAAREKTVEGEVGE